MGIWHLECCFSSNKVAGDRTKSSQSGHRTIFLTFAVTFVRISVLSPFVFFGKKRIYSVQIFVIFPTDLCLSVIKMINTT